MQTFSISNSAAAFIAARVRRGELKLRRGKLVATKPAEKPASPLVLAYSRIDGRPIARGGRGLHDRLCVASHAGRGGYPLGRGRFAAMSRGQY